jgi:hypothetical protein
VAAVVAPGPRPRSPPRASTTWTTTFRSRTRTHFEKPFRLFKVVDQQEKLRAAGRFSWALNSHESCIAMATNQPPVT